MASSEDRKEELERESFYKTKIIQFLGRTTPIILQNDNGPCPLLAICNVLLLKNNLNLTVDVAEISQEKLLSLVAERLIDSNSNNRSDGYAENQQKNIADAIDLLPRLATGIDVNIKFRRIDDFEFTRECAIFDLLDIPVYHGWIVDPQDHDTASAIGSKSYNTLVEEVVALVTQNVDRKCDNITEDDCVDFAAATAATLGVPSPCLSRGRSFNDSPHSVLDEQKLGKGEKEEEAELLRALNLSEEPSSQVDSHLLDDPESEVVVKSSKSQIMHAGRILEGHNDQMQLSILDDHTTPGNDLKRPATLDTMTEIVSSSSSVDIKNGNDHLTLVGSGDNFPCKYVDENSVTGKLVLNGSMEHQPIPVSVDNDAIGLSVDNEVSFSHSPGIDQSSPVRNSLNSPAGDSEHQGLSMSTSDIKNATDSTGLESTEVTSLHLKIEGSDTSVGRAHDITDTFTSSVRDDEPMYEGEECVLDAGKKVYEEKEPMYEGEVVLAKQSYKDTTDAADVSSKNELTDEKGELKRNFLVNNASQLSIYGLFCLQEGLKERELCVFFRNNHFNTMFKFDGQLYLLVTDQGYINQPDLVWERLNEVNGNTVFVTSDFKEFKAESNDPSTWDERKAVTNTAGFLSSIDPSKESSCSDFQLAVALQQQEFEQQPERHNVPQTTASSGSSRLVTDPQRSSVRPTPPRQEAKSKEKCIVM